MYEIIIKTIQKGGKKRKYKAGCLGWEDTNINEERLACKYCYQIGQSWTFLTFGNSVGYFDGALDALVKKLWMIGEGQVKYFRGEEMCLRMVFMWWSVKCWKKSLEAFLGGMGCDGIWHQEQVEGRMCMIEPAAVGYFILKLAGGRSCQMVHMTEYVNKLGQELFQVVYAWMQPLAGEFSKHHFNR